MADTIAAIATGTAVSAIGIVRVSGPDAIRAVDEIFTPDIGAPFAERKPRTLIYGTLRDRTGAVIDHCLATLSRGPYSYTGEDTCELQCHGSPVVLRSALEALFAHGVRQARAGEFTKRAFLNGRMDLTQAEAVIDLIDAQSAAAARNAAGQLSGAIRRRIDGIYDELVNVSAHFDAVLDYSDEDLEPFEVSEIRTAAENGITELTRLLATVRRGQQVRSGVPCAIIGAPNAGKSSLLNALLGYDRAIVTEIPGTTRDTLQESAELGGIPLRLIDTAGLRETGDAVERLGVERSRRAMEEADLILAVTDGSRPLTEEDRSLLREASATRKAICILNKCDLPAAVCAEELREMFDTVLVLSAATGEGLDRLETAVAERFADLTPSEDGELLTSMRQAEAAGRARDALLRVREGLDAGMTPDGLLTDTEDALAALGEITGRSVTEDITSRIFERFCVGK